MIQIQDKCIHCNQTNSKVLIKSFLNKFHQTHCISCIVKFASNIYQPIQYLLVPYLIENQKKNIYFHCLKQLQISLEQNQAIGLAIIGKNTKQHGKLFWPFYQENQVKIQINKWKEAIPGEGYLIIKNDRKNETEKKIIIQIEFNCLNLQCQSLFVIFKIQQIDYYKKFKEISKQTLQPLRQNQYKNMLSLLKKSKIIYSIICPVSRKVMSVPVKFQKCKHIQTFDIKSFQFLLFKYNTTFIKCPLCPILAKSSQIMIDLIQYQIIEQQQECLKLLKPYDLINNTGIIIEKQNDYLFVNYQKIDKTNLVQEYQ